MSNGNSSNPRYAVRCAHLLNQLTPMSLGTSGIFEFDSKLDQIDLFRLHVARA